MTDGLARVGLRDFDAGVFLTMQADLIDLSVPGGTRKAYALDVGGVTTNVPGYEGKVPVFFAYPEDVYQPLMLPCFLVRRTGLTPAFERAPWYGWRKAPATGATPEVVTDPQYPDKYKTGYSGYSTQWNGIPMNIGYDIQVMARRQNVGVIMLTQLLMICRPPYFTCGVVDDQGDLRQYDAGAVQISSASELADVADRTIAWTVSFEVQGELDLWHEETYGMGQGDGGTVGVYPVIRMQTKVT